MKRDLSSGWQILQDVHDTGERLGLHRLDLEPTEVGHQLSEWEPLDRLEHLQVAFAATPYWGRELRHFNQAPWWYLNEFDAGDLGGEQAVLTFSNVDYFCRVWLNGVLVGEHEGYSTPFSFEVGDLLDRSGPNRLVVKVWSPWDKEVYQDAVSTRTVHVVRDLVKGTYEHDDTLIARDVNPVGIYGAVTLTTTSGPRFVGRPRVTYSLTDDLKSARVTVRGSVAQDSKGSPVSLKLDVSGPTPGVIRASISAVLDGADFDLTVQVDDVELWSTWDRGEQPLYGLRLGLAGGEVQDRRIGFRTVELDRDQSSTTFHLNGHSLFVRGTSYFPDVYISRMNRERYLRDLTAIRRAGFNLVRVHVHVENAEFYELCDELGLAVMQDSEFNWTHPVTSEWADRLVRIYEETILLLDDHPSLICWICLNEPGVWDDQLGRSGGRAMEISPGPQLYEAVRRLDPSRPIIKGSFCADDPLSGDSHNYTGSLEGPGVGYTAIDGTTEKLNTEFGFDAPGLAENLIGTGAVYRRLAAAIPRLADLQDYQYRLIKYYIEHYRTQKYTPCSGYVQFMFIDLGPQSFYGVYDWWGTPKPALDALLQSNQPVVALIEQTATQAHAIWLINDSLADLGPVTVRWTISEDGHDGKILSSGTETAECGPDDKIRITALDLGGDEVPVRATVTARSAAGVVLCDNQYPDLFGHPPHPYGHPSRMSHELGVRLYDA